jgi:hypothetical protein
MQICKYPPPYEGGCRKISLCCLGEKLKEKERKRKGKGKILVKRVK